MKQLNPIELRLHAREHGFVPDWAWDYFGKYHSDILKELGWGDNPGRERLPTCRVVISFMEYFTT